VAHRIKARNDAGRRTENDAADAARVLSIGTNNDAGLHPRPTLRASTVEHAAVLVLHDLTRLHLGAKRTIAAAIRQQQKQGRSGLSRPTLFLYCLA